MWLIVGLGNPGPTYRRNRHNLGFRVVERLAARAAGRWRSAPDALWCDTRLSSSPVQLLLPHRFMNRSGRVVANRVSELRIPSSNVLVVHDDVDLPLGRLRLKAGGGHGGHNGLRSLSHALSDAGYLRVRCGIGRPPDGDVVGWVLGDFPPQMEADLAEIEERAGDAIQTVVAEGLPKAASIFNVRPPNEATVCPKGEC